MEQNIQNSCHVNCLVKPITHYLIVFRQGSEVFVSSRRSMFFSFLIHAAYISVTVKSRNKKNNSNKIKKRIKI